MKKYLLFLFLFIFLIPPKKAVSQRNYKLIVTQVSTNIGDCDGCCVGDSDPLWRFYINGSCQDRYETTCNGCTNTVSYTIYDATYNCSGSQPTSIDVGLSGCENDGATSCSVPICDGGAASGTWTESLPATTGTFSDITRSATNGSGCQGGKYFSFTYHWEVSGSFITASNDNICSADDLGSKGPGSGTTTINYDNRCASLQLSENNPNNLKNSMWWRFQTPSAPAGETSFPAKIYIKENGCGSDNVNVRLYRRTGTLDCNFAEPISDIGGDYTCSSANFDEWMDEICLQYGQEYYIQGGYSDDNCALDLNGGSSGCFQIQMKLGDYPAYDKVCNAFDLSPYMPSGAVSVSQSAVTIGNFYNFCAGRDAGEPNSGSGDRTVWFKVKTGANVGDNLIIDASGLKEFCLSDGGGSALAGAKLDVYKMATTDPNSCSKDSLVTQAGTSSFLDESNIKIQCPTPNTWYYLQIQARNALPALCEEQEFNVTISMDALTGTLTRPANDNVCNAINIAGADAIINANTNETPVLNQNNQCASTELEEAALGGAGASDKTIWYSFKTDANPPIEATIDATYNNSLLNTRGNCSFWFGLANGTFFPRVRVYSSSRPITGACTGINQLTAVPDDELLLGVDPTQGTFKLTCLQPNTWYYVQVYTGFGSICDDGAFDIKMSGGPIITRGPDRICNALDIGTATYGGPIVNTNNNTISVTNHTNRCATVGTGEPDQMTDGLDKTVWYKFQTPAAPAGMSQLQHTYQIQVINRNTTPLLTYPAFTLWKDATNTGTRTCTGAGSSETAASFSNLIYVEDDFGFDITNDDANEDRLCLEPSTWYYIQIDHAGAGSYIDYDITIKKDAFRPGDNICEATDLGIITSNGLATGTPTNVNWTLANKFTVAPYFALPHTNKCASGEPGEPNSTPGGPNPNSGTHSATVWYKLTTGNTVPDWIYWYNDDNNFSNGNRGCLGLIFNSEVSFYKSNSAATCPVGTNLELQDEMNIPGDLCDHTSGIGFGAPCYLDMFRLKCPEPNTTYWVQVTDAGTFSTCYEGQWTFDNSDNIISTAPGIGGAPINDTICGAIDLGQVPNGGTLVPTSNANGNGPGIFDNFCATPDIQWRADFSQPLDRDVWFRFKPPLSGSVRITAQSAPSGSPGVDDDLDLQVAVWEPILGDGSNAHCSDPRFLWTPLIAQDHGMCELSEQQTGFTNCFLGGFFPYDIYNTCGNSSTCNEGNSLIVTCLDPNKYYYIQVDGGDYPGCDLIDAGDCIMGYFKMQIADAGLGLYNSSIPADVGTPYTGLGYRNNALLHDEPCFAQNLTVNASATAYSSLNWTKMTNRCATSINDPIPSEWAAKNSSTDKTVWAKFIAPPSGKVKIRSENIAQIKGDADYHENINLQLAVYQTSRTCYDKWALSEIGQGHGFDGGLVENDPLNTDDRIYCGVLGSGPCDQNTCVPGVGTCGYDEYLVARCLIPGKEYFIMIDGDEGYTSGADVEDIEGDFRISVQELNGIPASTNDSICNAYNMGTMSNVINAVYTTPIPFNNECATVDQSYEGAGKIAQNISGMLFNFNVEHTLWFKFVAPSSGKVKIEAINDGSVDPIDLGLALYDIPTQNCWQIQSNGFEIQDDYDPGVLTTLMDEQMTVSCLVPGRTYWLQVDGDKNASSCGPLLTGTDCETGQFKVRITTLAADPTYASNVTYTSPATTQPGGNDNFCQSHNIYNASGTYNPLNQNTFLHPGETINFHHNNRCATSQQNEPEANGWDLNPFNTGSDPTVWYTFNTGPSLGALRPGDITIRITNPSGTCFDPDLDLYEYDGTFNVASCNSQTLSATEFAPLVRVGEGKVFNVLAPREEEIKITCPRANTRYFLRVLGTSTCPLFGDDQGEFDISVSMSAININFQTNDDICGASNMGTLASGGALQLLNQNNICATQQIGEPNTTQGAVQNEPEYDETMWYKFTTSANPGAIQVVLKSLLGVGGFNAVPSITVYKYIPVSNASSTPCSTTPFANMADLASNMGFATLLGNVTIDSAKVTLPCVTPNATYFIQVDGADASLFGITVPTFTDNFYYNLYVRDLGSGTGRPSNDDLVNALPVDNVAPIDGLLTAGSSLTVSGHNRCATCETGENGDYCGADATDHENSNEDETVWYYFTTPSKPGVITVNVADDPAVTSEVLKPNFRIYYNNGSSPYFRTTAAPTGKLIQEGSSADNTLNNSSVSNSYTCLLPNTKYWIQVDGNDISTDQGNLIITVTDDGSGNPGPSNDLICNAENLTLPTAVLGRTNKCAWEETGEPNTSSNIGGSGDDVEANDYDETVWFTFVPSSAQDVTMILEPTSGINGGIKYVLYEKTATATITCSGTPADIPTWTQLREIASGTGLVLNTIGTTDQVVETWPCLDPAKRYYIQVDGNDLLGSNDVGNFNIQLTTAVHAGQVNDNICGIGATAAQGNIGTFTTSATVTASAQDNRCATQEVSEPNVNGNYNDITDPNYDHSLWYKFTASNTDGTYTVNVTNVGADAINADIVIYRQDGTTCPATNFSSLTEIKSSSSLNSVTNDESLALECWEIEEGKTYYVQVQGWDAIGGGDVGNNFNVSVQFTAGTTNNADNICTAPTVAVNGVNQTADNRCATTQTGEPNISPSPQTPADGSAYDETLWYTFTAPASGEVRLNTSSYSSVLLSLNADLYLAPVGYNCATNGFTGLVREDNTSTLTSVSTTWDLRCLAPGRTYYLRFDGNDATTDRGTWNFNLTNLNTAPTPPVNDEPCGAIDVTQYIRTAAQGPCTNDNQYYTNVYSINTTVVPNIDNATRTPTAIGCNGEMNCNDYWFKFTVPLDATGIRVQGNDEYPVGSLTNNSHEHIAIYRATGGCGSTLQQINCDDGGFGADVDFTLAAYPGETLYLQVFDENAPASSSNNAFGYCLSVDCPAKTVCGTNSLSYNQPQCWNMNTNGTTLTPQYYDCLPGSNNSVNYFTFSTDCDGTPVDTVQLIFSVTDLGCGATAMSMFLDNTPCAAPLGQYDYIVVNCAVFESVTGGTTATNFNQTYILSACSQYVVQIISDENTSSCASSGQIILVKSTTPPTQVLPVELTSFTGYNDGNANVIDWITSSEINTSKFEVEKSTDGFSFSYIGEKPAAGNSTTPRTYQLIDNNPFIGNNYYRLKMIDLDGTFDYSDKILIKVAETNANEGIVNIYPNPTKGEVNIVYQASKDQNAVLSIFNTIGQLMLDNAYQMKAGINTITISADDYAKGLYIINLQNAEAGVKYQSKFIKE